MIRGFEIVDKKHRKNEQPSFPIRKTQGSAGYDFIAPVNLTLKPKEQKFVWTDIKAKMPENEFLMIQIRSSLGVKNGIELANTVGIIDSDYYGNPGNDGNIGFALKNTSKNEVKINKGEGITQGIFIKYMVAENCNTANVRGGGFGSTDN